MRGITFRMDNRIFEIMNVSKEYVICLDYGTDELFPIKKEIVLKYISW